MASDTFLYIFCYVKRNTDEKSRIAEDLFQVLSTELCIPRGDYILQVNGIDVRGQKLKKLKAIFDSLPYNNPVFLSMLKNGGNRAYLDPKFAILVREYLFNSFQKQTK